jgi:(2Fe-2S) ferredoxin
MGQYRYHVFVCTSGAHCPAQGSETVHSILKKGVSELGLKGLVRVNHAGCMNQCGHGPMVVVYPEDTWYHAVDPYAAKRILREHLAEGRVVEEYRYHAPPGDNKDV